MRGSGERRTGWIEEVEEPRRLAFWWQSEREQEASRVLLESEPEGRAVRYRPTPAPMSEAVDWMTAVGRQWDARLAALSRSLER